VISPPFSHALSSAFLFGLVAMLIAATASRPAQRTAGRDVTS
jgi:hypothetical protein